MGFKKISKMLVSLSIAVIMGISSFAWNVFATTESSIDEIINKKISTMTLEQKLGQMLQLDFRQWNDEDVTTINEDIKKIIDEYDLGGVILFANNVKETAQTTKLVHDLQNVIENDSSNDIPLFITVDQEGGIVTRLGTGTNLPGNMALGATRNETYAYNAGKIIGTELKALGINVNFAPVLDVNNNPSNPVINVRSISSDPNLVGKLGTKIIQGIQETGISATAKHFPGHGDTATDSHYGLPIIEKSLDELQNTELIPFKFAINNGIDMIMTAHIGMPKIENEIIELEEGSIPLPATLSDDVITGILRNELGYDGVVITDALNMEAITENFTESEAVIKTINAGVDIALMPTILRNNQDVSKLQTIIENLVEAVKLNEISENRINDSVYRILKLKLTRGIWNPNEIKKQKTLDEKIKNAESIVGNPEHRLMENEISESAVTLVKNENYTLPFTPKENQNILVISPLKEQTDSMIKTINNLISSKKINKVNVDYANYNKETLHLDENIDLKNKIKNVDYIIVGSNVSSGEGLKETSYARYIPEEIFDYSNELGKKSVLISLRNPYDVATIKNANAQIIIYGHKGDPNGPDSESGNQKSAGPNLPAGIRSIFGDFIPQGKLPVDIPVVEGNEIQNKTLMPIGFNIKNIGRDAVFYYSN